MIIHHMAISNTDSAGFIVVLTAQIRLLRKLIAFFPKSPLLPCLNLIRPMARGMMLVKGEKLKINAKLYLQFRRHIIWRMVILHTF